MKLLIISGPYEADRLRKAAVSAGFEAVAVEPGESLSGWITASRPGADHHGAPDGSPGSDAGAGEGPLRSARPRADPAGRRRRG
jgi:hypothetical protein